MGSRLGDPVFGDEPESESLHQVLDFGSESSLSATERATAETVSDRVPTAEEKPTGSPVGRTTRDDNFVRHRIIDGDTLEKLAARYLSSPDRWREIFDRNRGVLQSPDLLPIDAVLMIPVRSVRTPATRVDGGQ